MTKVCLCRQANDITSSPHKYLKKRKYLVNPLYPLPVNVVCVRPSTILADGFYAAVGASHLPILQFFPTL